MTAEPLKSNMTKEKLEAFEKQFKKKHGLLEENLTPEEAYALRRYIEEMEETIGYFVRANLVSKDKVSHLTKFRDENYQRGYKKLLGIGGTND